MRVAFADQIGITVLLQEQIDSARQTIKAEAYSMSIGEIANLYRDRELVIRPEFQRLFRWTDLQKSRLIESVLLGIPLPSIFVMQREDGVWEVVDGLQRLSTVLEFMGELRDESTGELLPASVLHATTYLPALAAMTYAGDESNSFSSGQRLALKRAKLDLKILLPESDAKSKFELFDRLNAGGSVATAQEVRNALILMKSAMFFEWFETLRTNAEFKGTLTITDRLLAEAYDGELVCRFLAIHNSSNAELAKIDDIDSFLSTKVLGFADGDGFDRDFQGSTFATIFSLLQEALGEDAFRRYDPSSERFLGGFSVSAFESITSGLAHSLPLWSEGDVALDLAERVKALWSYSPFRSGSGSGIRASTRINKTIPAARLFFMKRNED